MWEGYDIGTGGRVALGRLMFSASLQTCHELCEMVKLVTAVSFVQANALRMFNGIIRSSCSEMSTGRRSVFMVLNVNVT